MGEADWIAVFDRDPDIMWRIVGDIYDVVKTEEEKAAGKRVMGRRPPRSGSLEDVWATVFPAPYSMDPFPEALRKLMNGRSQSAFAMRVPIHQTTLSRMLKGEWMPDLQMLERIAEAAKVQPAYFVEWRAQYVAGLIQRVLMERPNMSVMALRQVKHGRKELDSERAS